MVEIWVPLSYRNRYRQLRLFIDPECFFLCSLSSIVLRYLEKHGEHNFVANGNQFHKVDL